MKRIKWIVSLMACIYGGAAMAMTLNAAFPAGGAVPIEYTCEGKDVSPSLTWGTVPEGTKSFALIMEDPDAPNGVWVHWVLFNIQADIRMLTENSIPTGAIVGKNSWQTVDYKGPCPPSGVHRYVFTLYALNTALTLPTGATAADVRKAAKSHMLGQVELVGKYKRSN